MVAFVGRQLANQHTATNQKQAAATEGRMEGICDKWDAWGMGHGACAIASFWWQ